MQKVLSKITALCLVALLLVPIQVQATEGGSSMVMTTTVPAIHNVRLVMGTQGVVLVNGVEYRDSETIAIERLIEQEYIIQAHEGWLITSVVYDGVEQMGNHARTMFTNARAGQSNTDVTQFAFTASAINEDGQLSVTFAKGEVEVTDTKLQEEVDKIQTENLNESDYTADSWVALQDALKKAEEVLNNPNATQAEIDETLRNLSEARANLKKATDQDPTDQRPTGQGGTGTKGQNPPSATNLKGSGVNTGDTSNLLLYGGIGIMSMIGVGVLISKKNKQ